ncbi:MAG: hypothetical protein ABSE95_15745 [Thermodesulfobacteriota bacterium]
MELSQTIVSSSGSINKDGEGMTAQQLNRNPIRSARSMEESETDTDVQQS